MTTRSAIDQRTSLDEAWSRCAENARTQAGVVSRRQLYRAGLSRGVVRAQLRAGRWRVVGRHSVSFSTGPLSQAANEWAAVLEGGPRAHLDGISALLAAGLEHFTADRIRVSVPKGARIQRRRNSIANLRETRRFRADDIQPGSEPPRTKAPVATVHAALWAATDRQATLLLTMVVQQGLCRPEEIAQELLRIRRDKRRALIQAVLGDLVDGVRSLGELDVLRGCRDRGLPIPDQQQVRRTPRGNYYLDHRWKNYGLVVEVDGVQHSWASELVGDALRHNTIALEGDVVLRLPVLGLRLCPDDFFDQIRAGLRRGGWVDVRVGRSA